MSTMSSCSLGLRQMVELLVVDAIVAITTSHPFFPTKSESRDSNRTMLKRLYAKLYTKLILLPLQPFGDFAAPSRYHGHPTKKTKPNISNNR